MIWNTIREEIQAADKIVVGIGAELSAKRLLPYDAKEIDDFYQSIGMTQYEMVRKASEEQEEMAYLRDLYYFYYIRTHKIPSVYDELAKWLEGKDYFIITSNTDDFIYCSSFDEARIVSPCGTRRLFQCSYSCSHSLYPSKELMLAKLKEYEETKETSQIACGKCKEPLVFNVRTKENASNYMEEGYLSQWSVYTKWLQGTLNKRFVALELGEGFEQPTLFHWPFERLVYFNQKAKLIRVHKKLSQVGEELKERAMAVPMDSMELLQKGESYGSNY